MLDNEKVNAAEEAAKASAQSEKPAPKKRSSRQKKTDDVATAVAETTPASEQDEQPTAPPRRRRATRAAAPPEPVTIEPIVVRTAAASQPPQPSGEQAPVTTARPRRRATREAAPPEPVIDVDTVPVDSETEELTPLPIEPAADVDEAEVADTVAEDTPEEPDSSNDDESEDAGESGEDGESGDDESGDDDESGEDSLDDEEPQPRRRRRRRGGRRRRRRSSDTTSEDTEEESEEDQSDDEEDSEESDSSDDTRSVGTRRRRRRRRRGEDISGADDDPTDVVVRVREPRRGGSDEVTGIEGSTRIEAKRQRRREGRQASRRRTPILSEAEFLSRRESVDRRMVIRQREDFVQIAVLEDGMLVEHYVDRDSAASLIGNIYLGKVQNVLPSMEAAFIDIGRGRNAVLYAGEVDWDAFGATGENRKIENVLKSGQNVVVQVTKDPVGAKGARLTHHISIPGRYIVYSPSGHLSGISRKLPENERKRLRDILAETLSENESVIVRTAAEGASEEELTRDLTRLKAQWEAVEKKGQGSAPQMLHAEPDLTLRIVRDLFTEDFSELLVSGSGGADDSFDMVDAYVAHVAPHLHDRIKRWDNEQGDVFAAHRVDEQIAKALERKVHLPSGGSLVIDRTEAMTVIDVNTGKFTGSGGNLEATVASNNLEAAEEIVRQLRLRDIGGIIVIDFIDMVLPSNRELLLRRLVECLGRDRTRHQVSEVTSLGLVQMTRKRIGTGLAEAFTTPCECCHNRGYHVSDAPVPSQLPADGGDRRGRRRGGRGRSAKNDKPKDDEAPATTDTQE